MSSRDDILASVRANLPGVDRPLPAVPMVEGSPPASLLSAFKESLHRMGGVFLDPPASGDPERQAEQPSGVRVSGGAARQERPW